MTPAQHNKKLAAIKQAFLINHVPKLLIVIGIVMAIAYTLVLMFWFQVSNFYLFGLLIAGQLFFLWQAFSFMHTIWDTSYMPRGNDAFTPPVDVFITVAGEPVDIVEETLKAAVTLDYPLYYVHILNDGYVAKKENWHDIELLALQYGANCITRRVPGGAKAGNINNALRQTKSPFVAIFDADHVPHRDFLRKTMRYMADPKMGFVQSPQFYKNYFENDITRGSWEQQSLFFGSIMRGKNRLNAVIMCGTNMVIRREPLEAVGGMCDTNIAEDFVTGLFIHQSGWKSAYVPEVLAEGLAPEDFLSYYKQQLRWARGSLEVLFKYNPLFKRGLTLGQKIQYLASASYYLSGVFIIMNMLIPFVFFWTGIVPFLVSTMALAIIFLPYIFLTLYIVQRSSNFTYTFRALAFSMSSWTIHIRALTQLLLGMKSSFAITSKKAIHGNFIRITIPHILYIIAGSVGIVWAMSRFGLSASVATNSAWVALNCAILYPFIYASSPLGTRSRDIVEEDELSERHVLTQTTYALPKQRIQ